MRVTFDEANRPLHSWAVAATVQVTKRTPPYTQGTGFIISDDGIIMTAYHVVTRSRTVNVRMLKLDKKGWRIRAHGRYVADVVYRDKRADIALLKLRKTPPDITAMSLGDSDNITLGIPLARVGCDHDSRRVAEGYVFALTHFDGNRLPRIDISMPTQVGNSGGPVYTLDGLVIGVSLVAGGTRGQPAWTGVLPINTIRQRLAWRKEIKELLPPFGWPE